MMLYRLLVGLLSPIAALAMALHPRTRATWLARWGWVPPSVPPGAVVIHAASVGEGGIAHALFEELRAARPAQVLVRTAWTDTGLASSKGAHATLPLPVDLACVVGPWLDRLRPALLVLVETELWPNLLAGCARRGVPVLVVGTRNSLGFKRLRSSFLWFHISSCVSAWLPAQDLPSLARGLGSLKGLGRDVMKLSLASPVVVAASTRAGDEAALLRAHDGQGTLILAPRHPERFEQVAQLADFARRSLGQQGPLMLWDTVGELSALIPLADCVFVGGTLDPRVGGHSPMEALRAGIPVVAGPAICNHSKDFDPKRCVVVEDADELAQGIHEALSLGRVAPSASAALGPTIDGILQHIGQASAPGPMRPWLSPLTWIWRLLSSWPSRERRAALPVVSVGGLSAGGSGKTPVVRWLAERLSALGHTPAVVSRGYGRSPGTALRVEGDLGDELQMLSAQGLICVSSPDRLAGVARAKELGATVVVLDDAFQHRGVARDLDIVVVDALDPLDGGLIPVGHAREGLGALKRADLVLWMGPPTPGKVSAELLPIGWHHRGQDLPLEAGPEGAIHAFCGIARPGRFLQTLVRLGVEVRGWSAFADHHRFEVGELPQGLAVCTEKDLPRLPAGHGVWALRMGLRVRGGEVVEALLRRLPAS